MPSRPPWPALPHAVCGVAERGPPSRPSRLTHVRVEPGAKPFVDDLLLGRGFVRSRAAPSLRSIESQPSTQGFVSAGRAGARSPPASARTRASVWRGGGTAGALSLARSRPPPRTGLSSVSRRRRVTLSRSSFPPGEGGGPSPRPCRAPASRAPLPALAKPVWGAGREVSRQSAVGSRRARIATARPSQRRGVPSWPGAGERRRSRPVFSPFFSPFSLFLCLRSRAGAIPARLPDPGACPGRRWSREPLFFLFFSGQRG